MKQSGGEFGRGWYEGHRLRLRDSSYETSVKGNITLTPREVEDVRRGEGCHSRSSWHSSNPTGTTVALEAAHLGTIPSPSYSHFIWMLMFTYLVLPHLLHVFLGHQIIRLCPMSRSRGLNGV